MPCFASWRALAVWSLAAAVLKIFWYYRSSIRLRKGFSHNSNVGSLTDRLCNLPFSRRHLLMLMSCCWDLRTVMVSETIDMQLECDRRKTLSFYDWLWRHKWLVSAINDLCCHPLGNDFVNLLFSWCVFWLWSNNTHQFTIVGCLNKQDTSVHHCSTNCKWLCFKLKFYFHLVSINVDIC